MGYHFPEMRLIIAKPLLRFLQIQAENCLFFQQF